MERIDRVAIQWGDELFTAEAPARHHHIIRAMAARGFGPECMHEQGFVTDTGRFVDRLEGLIIAQEAGQIKNKTAPANQLFSEDLW